MKGKGILNELSKIAFDREILATSILLFQNGIQVRHKSVSCIILSKLRMGTSMGPSTLIVIVGVPGIFLYFTMICLLDEESAIHDYSSFTILRPFIISLYSSMINLTIGYLFTSSCPHSFIHFYTTSWASNFWSRSYSAFILSRNGSSDPESSEESCGEYIG